MSLISIRKSLIASSMALMILCVGSFEADAQSRRERQRELQRIQRNARLERQRTTNMVRQERMTRREYENAYFRGGYEQGYLAGTSDARRKAYNRSNVYRGTGSAPNLGDPTSSDYIYRQGYLAGYEDGYHRRRSF